MGKSIHHLSTAALSVAMAVIGLALIGQALLGGGGGLAVRLVLGALFLAAGCGRLYLLTCKSRDA